MSKRYAADNLLDFAESLCLASGMGQGQTSAVAQILLEGDLLGHNTHGLQLLAPYLNALGKGAMRAEGDVTVLSERAAIALWDGHYLPGPWLVCKAIETAQEMARQCGTGTVVIRQSSHIGALAAYLEAPARDGFLIQILCSDPSVASVAPFGGSTPVYTPNPMAWGIPASGNPILIDISASTTTNGMSGRLHEAGEKGEHNWWLDALGKPCNDPSVLFQNPAGSLLPLGGTDAGHKGYGLALYVEAMTAGLAGHGRADDVNLWGASVQVQLTDVNAVGERQAFDRQIDHLIDACLQSPPADADKPVRLPGHRGLALKSEQLENGVILHPAILPSLQILADEKGIEMPAPL